MTPEGADMIYNRYHYASELAVGKRVLEIACGSGTGLGLVGHRAEQVIAGDLEFELLRQGRCHYGDRFAFVQFTAGQLPFRDSWFHVVLVLEAAYYVEDMARLFDETKRILTSNGTVVFVSANPERRDFIPSPFTHHYYAADEFRDALEARGFAVEVEGAYPVEGVGGRAWIYSSLRKLLKQLRLVPRSLRGRAILKRLAFGKLIRLPAELREGFAAPAVRTPLKGGPATQCKVIYVTARLVQRPSVPAAPVWSLPEFLGDIRRTQQPRTPGRG